MNRIEEKMYSQFLELAMDDLHEIILNQRNIIDKLHTRVVAHEGLSPSKNTTERVNEAIFRSGILTNKST